MSRFVIIGGGLAGHSAAAELTGNDPQADVHIFSAETAPAYYRPSLSKGILLRSEEPDAIGLTGLDAGRVHYHLETAIDEIDAGGQRIRCSGGAWHSYDRLLLATGSRPVRIDPIVEPGVDVHYLRTLEDSVRLRDALTDGLRLLVIGGGFIGLEVAAAARGRGCTVTLVEARPGLLSRCGSAALGEWARNFHQTRDNTVHLAACLTSLSRSPAGQIVAETDKGRITCDLVVAGIGIAPNAELAQQAGLDTQDGIVVDRQCRTSVETIFAAGEVTAHLTAVDGGRRRIESWKTAELQGKAAAKAMAGLDSHFDELPWFWSDQFDANIQSVGYSDLAAEHFYVGDPQSDCWTEIGLLPDKRVIGAVAVNRGRDISVLRRAIKSKQTLAELLSKNQLRPAA